MMFDRFPSAPRSIAAAALLLVACSDPPPPQQPDVVPEVVRVSPCPADVATIPALSLTSRGGEGALVVETLPTPTRGRCLRETEILSMDPSGARHFARIETATGSRLMPHRVHAFDVIPDKSLVLAAGDSGLWVHDASSLARLARIVARRIVDVTVSEDGKRFAYITQDRDPEDSKRTLVIVEVSSLAVLRSFEGVPEGRMHLADDGHAVVLAAQDLGIRLYDDGGMTREWVANDTVRDAVIVPGTQMMVAYVGHDNYVGFHDMASGAEVLASRRGAFVTRRDLESVRIHASSRRTFAGGADNELHVYEGMMRSDARELAHVRLDGNVVDVACCSGEHVVAITDVANVVWLNGAYQPLREIGPFLPDAASVDARVELVGDRTYVNLFGRIFQWTRDGLFVVPDSFVGEVVSYREQGGIALAVLRARGKLEFHRIATTPGAEQTSEMLDVSDWAVIDASFEVSSGAFVYVGREHGRVMAASVPSTGPISSVRGPLLGLGHTPVIVPKGDGQHFALWDLGTRLIELDALAPTFTVVGLIEGGGATRFDVRADASGWVVTDETGSTRTLATPPPPPPAPRCARAARKRCNPAATDASSRRDLGT
jgi:hypothetical protein